MSHDDKKCSCGCSSLYSVLVTVPADGEDGTVHEMKLFEQTHCARCWRPLLTPTAYPGTRTSNLPPESPKDRVLVAAASCGHVFHSTCVYKAPKCRQCHAHIKDVRQVNVVFEKRKTDDGESNSGEKREP